MFSRPQRFTTAQAATYLGIAKATLETWRSRKTFCISYTHVGRRVVYSSTDLDSFLARGRVEVPESPPAATPPTGMVPLVKTDFSSG
jgi:hypothetical protein